MSQPHSPDDDMPDDVDFSGGTRSKFYRAGAALNLPVYLENEVQTRLAKLANDRGVDFSTLVNAMLIEALKTNSP